MRMMSDFIVKLRKQRFHDGYVLILLAVFSFLYVYHLDYSTLSSWDEGWYAVISRTMVETGDFMNMKWLGKPFYDHPPMGMWLVAISYKLFGISEWSTRLPSALLGIGSVLMIYLLANELTKSRHAGFVAALTLGTAVWFFARARTGNLDAPFCFFYITTIYSALRAKQNPVWFLATGVTGGMLIMTKTLVGVSALPLILFASFPVWIRPRGIVYFVGGSVLWAGIVLPWYMHHMNLYPEFFDHHFKTIGTRNRTIADYVRFEPARQVLFYLHMGVGSWYKIWIASLVWMVARFYFVSDRRTILFLVAWNAGILFPFLSSSQSQLWHLIPVYIPLALTISWSLWDGTKFMQSHLPRYSQLVHWLLIICVTLVAGKNLKASYKEVVPMYRYQSERVLISREASQFTEKIYLDDDFLPEAIYYVGRDITPISAAAQDDPEFKNTLRGQFQTMEKDFVVITRSWATNSLDDATIPYVVRAENKDFKIISRPLDDTNPHATPSN